MGELKHGVLLLCHLDLFPKKKNQRETKRKEKKRRKKEEKEKAFKSKNREKAPDGQSRQRGSRKKSPQTLSRRLSVAPDLSPGASSLGSFLWLPVPGPGQKALCLQEEAWRRRPQCTAGHGFSRRGGRSSKHNVLWAHMLCVLCAGGGADNALLLGIELPLDCGPCT